MIDKLIVRHIKKDEIDKLLFFCEKHALYEKQIFSYKNKKKNFKKYLFAKNAPFFCLIIEYKNDLIAYATYMKQFSTWDADFYLYMDCLFIDEKYRNHGIGKIILKEIKNEAKKLNCTLMQWQTPIDNTKAIKFYKNNNAESKTKERFFLKV